MKARLNNVHDLFAVDAVYHQVAASILEPINQPISNSQQKKSRRPRNTIQIEAYLKVGAYLQENDDEQTSISDFIVKMKQYLGDSGYTPYHFTYMKDQLQQHYGNKIVVTERDGKTTIVTLRSAESTKHIQFYTIYTVNPNKGTLMLTNLV